MAKAKGTDGKAVDADQDANPIHGGGNLTALKAEISEAVSKIESLKADRASVNDDIAAIRSDLAAKGIPKKCLDMAMAYMNMDADKREGFDIAYGIVREAIGLPFDGQGELFDLTGKVTVKVGTSETIQ